MECTSACTVPVRSATRQSGKPTGTLSCSTVRQASDSRRQPWSMLRALRMSHCLARQPADSSYVALQFASQRLVRRSPPPLPRQLPAPASSYQTEPWEVRHKSASRPQDFFGRLLDKRDPKVVYILSLIFYTEVETCSSYLAGKVKKSNSAIQSS